MLGSEGPNINGLTGCDVDQSIIDRHVTVNDGAAPQAALGVAGWCMAVQIRVGLLLGPGGLLAAALAADTVVQHLIDAFGAHLMEQGDPLPRVRAADAATAGVRLRNHGLRIPPAVGSERIGAFIGLHWASTLAQPPGSLFARLCSCPRGRRAMRPSLSDPYT